jgi:5-methyltetrahydropteroyltriglutamate--homocysteine methyltransferase
MTGEPSAILTTHVGSLPRDQDVVDVVFAEDDGQPVDRAQFDRVIGEAVGDRVARQVDAGIDLVSDGEMSKIGYATYVRHHLSGFVLDEVPRWIHAPDRRVGPGDGSPHHVPRPAG